MLSHDEILAFVNENALSYTLVGVFQVGSTARGHALAGSDMDLMAFYDSSEQLESYRIHSEYHGQKVALENHDLTRFLEDTSDYRFNLASLRQLHKIRDGILHIQEEKLEVLLYAARNAHLDRSVVLHTLAKIARKWRDFSSGNRLYQKHQLISWTELLGTVYVVSRPQQEAYSKPKWVYRTLRHAGLEEAVYLLDALYQPTTQRIAEADEGMREIIDRYDVSNLEEEYQRLLATGVRYAKEMLLHCPEEALSPVRYITIQYHRLFFARNPLDIFARGERLPDEGFSKALGIYVPNKTESDMLIHTFLKFFTRLGNELSKEFEKPWTTHIGSRRMFTHILEAYDATELLPHISANQIREWVQDITLIGA